MYRSRSEEPNRGPSPAIMCRRGRLCRKRSGEMHCGRCVFWRQH
jgi:hypothetical protein